MSFTVSQAPSQKHASDGAQHLAMGPCIKNVTHDKSTTAKLVMNSRSDFAQNRDFDQIRVPNGTNINVKYHKTMNKIIGDGVNNADGAQGPVMGHKPLVMGHVPQRPPPYCLRVCCRLVYR